MAPGVLRSAYRKGRRRKFAGSLGAKQDEHVCGRFEEAFDRGGDGLAGLGVVVYYEGLWEVSRWRTN